MEKHMEPPCPLHLWFELSYASYLVLPRSVMQEMPFEWRERMAKCLDEICEVFKGIEDDGYAVQLRGKNGRFRSDPLANYRHPNTSMIEEMRNRGIRS